MTAPHGGRGGGLTLGGGLQGGGGHYWTQEGRGGLEEVVVPRDKVSQIEDPDGRAVHWGRV